MPPLLTALFPVVSQVIDRVVPDRQAAERAKAELNSELLSQAGALQRAAAEIVKSETASRHWLTATWRPILMLVITGIIANNYLLAPYLSAIFGVGLQLELPDRLWDLLTVGVGGYVIGRSAEKVTERWPASSRK